ncbi:hypothetical protein D3C72_1589360 [compost metagenome]
MKDNPQKDIAGHRARHRHLQACEGIEQIDQQPRPHQRLGQDVGQQRSFEVYPGQGHQRGGQAHGRDGDGRGSVAPGAGGEQRAGEQFNGGIAPADRRMASRAAAPQPEPTQHGKPAPAADRRLAGRTVRRGRQQAIAAGGPRLAHGVQALRLPFAFHHARQAVDQHRQPVADEQARQRRHADEDAQGQIEDMPHRSQPPRRRAGAWASTPRATPQGMKGHPWPCRNLCIKCWLYPRAAKGTYRIFA